ncbi:MAG: SDR family NAD(P)-dependent oxidoreductase, partial [Pseudomonadota bacterium]|nr:SDR family NAD(P)-dependent oxidoreductase [Pseudomonadota bacterium]
MTKVTLITGGSRGIGAATARLSAAEGHAVAINYRSDATAAEKVRAEVESVGAKAMVVQADTGVESDIMHMFEEVDRN